MAQSLTFGFSRDKVITWRDGLPFAVLDWEFALELGRAYQLGGRHASDPNYGPPGWTRTVSHRDEVREVRVEGDRVLILSSGVVVADFSGPDAIEIGNALIHVAHRAEEYSSAPKVIQDQALVMRKLGGAISLSGNPDINKEAWKEAETDAVLRRNIPTPISIQSREEFGYPKVSKELPEELRRAVRKLLLN